MSTHTPGVNGVSGQGHGRGRVRLRLAPSGPRGWFGGRGLSAEAPAREDTLVRGGSLAEAGEALQSAFEGRDRALVAVLLTYEGEATIVRFEEWTDAVGVGSGCEAAALPGREVPLIDGARRALDARAYRSGVRAVREAVEAGDVYVLNLTYQVSGAPALADASATFEVLRERAGAEMSALFAVPGLGVASVSPERFLRVSTRAEREVEVWPIKGTRPRGADPASDRRLAAELLASEKERSEHVMVVDMERNDLGRVCEPGSVCVDPLFEVVSTPYCHQMVSRVTGTLRPDASFADLLAAAFPCGSVTGAPKLAAIEIAARLEGAARGPYTGALLVARAGELDSSVLIRTAVTEGGRMSWGTGCGVTCDSDPAAEWLETLLKSSPVTGDGLPPAALRETCRVAGDGSVPLLGHHLARLAAGGCGPSVLARVDAEVRRELAHTSTVPSAAVTPPASLHRLAITVEPDGSVTCERTGCPSSLDVPGGPLAVPVTVEAVPALPPGAAKPADRTPWDRAQADLAPGEQAVLALPDGTLIDGASATVWLRRGATLLTPPAPPAVAGVAREVVFDLAGECGYEAVESELTLDDLSSADEVFFTNAYGGVVQARGRGGDAVPRLGERWPW